MANDANPTSAELLEEMQSKRGFLMPGHRVALEYNSEFMRRYDALATRAQLYTEEAQQEATVDRHTRELVMIGSLATRCHRQGVRLHVDKALSLGVSPQTIVEAMQVIMMTAGAPSYFMVMDELGEALQGSES